MTLKYVIIQLHKRDIYFYRIDINIYNRKENK